jgi:hypothetical protein
MAKVLVEEAGGRFSAAAVAAHVRFGRAAGSAEVGGRTVGWRATDSGVVVAHPPADPGGPIQEYAVDVSGLVTPTGGRRGLWACPACGRSAADLYLPPDRDRLGCRRCCGLSYRSQRTRVRGRPRTRGPRLEIESETLIYTPDLGWARSVTRRRA